MSVKDLPSNLLMDLSADEQQDVSGGFGFGGLGGFGLGAFGRGVPNFGYGAFGRGLPAWGVGVVGRGFLPGWGFGRRRGFF